MPYNQSLYEEAWWVRARNFPPDITFHYPVSTLPVSMTGDRCELRCAHCGGRFLKKMTPWEKFKQCGFMANEYNATVTSCLISGGCGSDGKVPFASGVEELKQIKVNRGLRYNFHVGLVDDKEANMLKGLADVVSFDFIGDDETIKNILGLTKTVGDYAATYKVLKANVRVVPHVCIGLDGGRIAGEYRVLELLADIGADALVFIVFMPAPGTALANREPPPLDEVARLLARARVKFPDIPIHLGCMRPGGRYRIELDCLAVRCGVNHLVMPARPAVELAKKLGLKINRRNECCVL